ncbi:MAG: pilus assembly protein PilM [Methylotenera sp. 24-45-7]|nr:MAG: pilus assembly protein PilM [Mehylophilales bacterium 35-46-6]OYZ40972.1 MAG: pilus assembly protein PilM [Methylotenera sp. 24-45-7]OZA09505.1 MAG: pilus assembly protein PilM [Methylotenera sp. 17-45-7]HQS38358.1 pilus assembly protein PilM [Methylotenera sp.]HQS43770.1 pilus assembly protein PilM [Methylotenera sp.]
MKFSFFTETTPPLIGIDVSSTSVKMVELSDDGRGGYKLESYAVAPLPADAMADGNVADLGKVADALKLAWKMLGTREKHAALALPSSAVISKKVIMTADLREEDMEAQVEGEANQYIPFPLDEVNIDFEVIGPAPNSEDEVEVLIVAARKEKIEDRVAAAEVAGLKVIVMDVDSYATEAAYTLVAVQLPNGGSEKTVMIVDIGASMMHINVLHDNKPVYAREQSFGGNQLTQEIQRRFGLSMEEAEISKRKGGLPESYESEVLQPFVQMLAMEVARAQQFFTSSTQYHHVDHIVLAGGCASIPEVEVTVQDKTQVHTVIANPFQNMSVSSRVRQAQVPTDAPALLIACGLAMRGVSA